MIKNSKIRNAILLGGLCAVSYLAVYIARNVLGTVSPQMIEKGVFTEPQIGTLSSAYFITYAVGQLINGAIGDKIKTKYMISFGLILAGLFCTVFTLMSSSGVQQPWMCYAAYAAMGFCLSMIYGPMTKVVSENVDMRYVGRCSLGYEFAALLGSPLAGLLAMFLSWQGVFHTGNGTLIGMGILCFLAFSVLERKGVVRYGQYTPPEREEGGKAGGIRLLIQKRIIRFTFISILTGVVRTTVVFWLPTYISQRLNFSSEAAALLFTISTLIISLAAFVAVFLYERLGNNMDRTILIAFTSSAIAFFAAYAVPTPALNVVFMILAILSANVAAAMLWSYYCPSLRDTGMVSGATGYLDFVSYMAASLSSTLFANAVADIGWGNLVLVWMGLMIVGVLISAPWQRLRRAA